MEARQKASKNTGYNVPGDMLEKPVFSIFVGLDDLKQYLLEIV